MTHPRPVLGSRDPGPLAAQRYTGRSVAVEVITRIALLAVPSKGFDPQPGASPRNRGAHALQFTPEQRDARRPVETRSQ
ncbi:hypothetical protein GCM10028802_26480 [Terrabacter terrigena]